MKILLITTRFHPHIGGVEEVVTNIAHNLLKEHDLRVVSSLDSGVGHDITKTSTDEKAVNGIKNKRIWINLPGSISGLLIFPFRFIKAVSELIAYTKEFNPDVINYHFPDDSAVYAYILAANTKVPFIVNIHGNDLQVFAKKPFHKFFIKRLLNKSSKIVVNSSYMKSEFLAKYPEFIDKVRIISNGLNVDIYKKTEAKEYFDEPYVFYVGRLVHKKGVDLLIRAFYKMNNLNLRLLIEGKGEELSDLKKIVKELDLESQVIFTEGNLTTLEKIQSMKAALFGVIPSRIEPFGIVALEFMAAGVPFVASKTGGLNDLLRDNETCLFFESDNLNGLVNKMEKLISDENLRKTLIKNGLEESQKYRWDVIAQKYYNLYNEDQ